MPFELNELLEGIKEIHDEQPQEPDTEKACGCVDEDTEKAAKEAQDEAYWDGKRKEVEIEQLKSKLQDSQQLREQRKEYANKIFYLVCGWLALLFLLIILSGCEKLKLSDSVLLGLITGTSVNVIGLMAIVAAYLFPKNGS